MKNRTALVTGGGRGIGRGIVLALAAKGWTVAVNYRSDKNSAADTAAEADRAGGHGFIIQADISDLSDHERLVQTVLDRTGRFDLLVNNAGMAPRERVDMFKLTAENYDELMRTNLRGPFFLTRTAAETMIGLIEKNPEESPAIINITSVSAVTASPDRAEYCISKAGLSMMTSLWAVRLAEYGINVYEIRPGIVRTDMTAGVQGKYDRLIEEGLTLTPRWGLPDDIGKAAAALAEGSFPYSTGEVFHVDGGFHVSRL